MTFNLKPDHKAVKAYYAELANLTEALNASSEGSVSPVFAALLRHCAGQMDFTLIEQYPLKRAGQNLRADGVLVDSFKLMHGIWEAKDSADDLDREIEKKVAKGYPRDNILFQAPRRAVLYQDGQRVMDANLTRPEELIEVLKLFCTYEPPAYEQWGQAVEEFKLKVPELGEALLKLIDEQRQSNPTFVTAFENFATLVRDSINPNISTQALEEMLIQHLLTERIFRTIFNNPDFASRNIIAREIEKVIQALTSRSFSRSEFLRSLDRFYGAIETTAATIDDFSQKQAFLNTVYEKFFQGFSVKAADVYGIVYTPQPIVNFMIQSVEHILQEEFGRSLSDEDVHIIDPFVGTGNFIINIMRHLKRTSLPYKYANELHCNEVMLLPYYIASMNIEHVYYELTNDYKPFEGICLVDTFDINEQMTIFGHENTERIQKQRNAPIFVVIANPPYNAGQVNENDNNKNRRYPILDKRISDTYIKASNAQLARKYNDPYIKAIRWATDRIGDEGIIALVNNSSFVNRPSFDGIRKHLSQDFDQIFILDLGGDVRLNPKLSGSTNNVFGIQLGVSINLFIKKKNDGQRKAEIKYAKLGEFDTKEQKYDFLTTNDSVKKVSWDQIVPDNNNHWMNKGMIYDYEKFIPVVSKYVKKNNLYAGSIFKNYSLGVATNRDEWVFNFNNIELTELINRMVKNYSYELLRIRKEVRTINVDDFINNDPHFIKWTDRLKKHLLQGKEIEFSATQIQKSLYRPFCRQYLYFDKLLNQRQYQLPYIFPFGKDNSLI